ncbi:MAG: hypothetical protein M0C28_12665 [Candidatus Moduliflexus flocculans]|nr:hypothetical protein [Candidatus Moduliflexus flocculans]
MDENGVGRPRRPGDRPDRARHHPLESKTDKKGHFAVAGLGSGTWRVSGLQGRLRRRLHGASRSASSRPIHP